MFEITESMVAGNVKTLPQALLVAIGLNDGRVPIAKFARDSIEDIEIDIPE